ncbi:hypothetical protein ACROYT_G017372 [Oculina patagonica]
MMVRLPASDCIPWLVVLITECLAIVILNVITIIVFVKQRQLHRRSTYLIIHLATVDLLVGGVSGPMIIEWDMRNNCDLWNNITGLSFLKASVRNLFVSLSICNLVFISLERLHATFRPFQHRFVKKWVFGIVVSVIWLVATSREFIIIVFHENRSLENFMNYSYLSICLFVICVCYIFIFIKVRCSPHPQHHGAANREKKLTVTLVLVTLASLLSWLPFTIFEGMSHLHGKTISNLSPRSYFHMKTALMVLVGANSLVNPIVYALRMPEYRKGIAKIFRMGLQPNKRVNLPLDNMKR